MFSEEDRAGLPDQQIGGGDLTDNESCAGLPDPGGCDQRGAASVDELTASSKVLEDMAKSI